MEIDAGVPCLAFRPFIDFSLAAGILAARSRADSEVGILSLVPSSEGIGPFAYKASNDVIQAEQMADAQLKVMVQEWENRMDNFKVVVESRFSEELNPTVYPQSPALA